MKLGIDFELGVIEWCNRKYSGALPNNFDADFSLCLNGKSWFSESVTVGELMIQLCSWLEKAKDGQSLNFEYSSLDMSDNPVFSVICDSTENRWYFVSRYENFKDVDGKSTAEILEALERLADLLEAQVVRQFGPIKISW